MKKSFILLVLSFVFPIVALADQGAFDIWKQGFEKKALAEGITQETLALYMPQMTYIERTITLDRNQPEFKQTFCNYIKTRINNARIIKGRQLFHEHKYLLWEIENNTPVPAQYLIAFWGVETNFGTQMGNFPLLSALSTMASDNRRPEFFNQQLMTLLKVLQKEKIDPPQGSWAGAFGQFQFIPTTYIDYAVDWDKDGKRDIVNSLPDAFGSAANYLRRMGWKKGQSWGREVVLPPGFDVDKEDEKHPISYWISKGIKKKDGKEWAPNDYEIRAGLLLPSGINGPAFLTYDNFDVIKKWNKSDFYALSVGILSDKIIEKKDTFDIETCFEEEQISVEDVKKAQEALIKLGLYDYEVDGIVGSRTKEGIKTFQKSQGVNPDGHLTKEILEKLSKVWQNNVNQGEMNE